MILNKYVAMFGQAMPLVLQGILTTLEVAICALAIGIVLGTIMGIFSCAKLKNSVVSFFISAYVLIMRGSPTYVQVLIFYYALPDALGINLSPVAAGIMALGFNSTAYVAEIVRCGINTIPGGQWDAAYVLGYSPGKTLYAVILPQMLRNIFPAMINEVTALLKETSVLSMIGVVELTRVALNISAKTLDPMSVYLAIAGIYFCITTTVSFLAKLIEKHMEI